MLNNVLMDEAGSGEVGKSGSGAAASAAPASAPPAAPGAAPAAPAAPGGSDSGKESSLLADLGKGAALESGTDPTKPPEAPAGPGPTPEQAALQAAEKDTRRPQHVPAKYWNTEKGEVNYEAWAKSTGELETRMRVHGLPPKSAEEYKFEVPKPLKDLGIDLDETTSKTFRGKAHELGLTQKQYESVMGAYFDNMMGMATGAASYGREKLNTELMTYYKTPESLEQNIRDAFAVVNTYGDDEEKEAAMGPAGNTPPWVYRVLAKVGKELKEDKGASPEAVLAGDSIEHLMRGAPGNEDSPYWNKEDPRHLSTVRKVTEYHQAHARADQRRSA